MELKRQVNAVARLHLAGLSSFLNLRYNIDRASSNTKHPRPRDSLFSFFRLPKLRYQAWGYGEDASTRMSGGFYRPSRTCIEEIPPEFS